MYTSKLKRGYLPWAGVAIALALGLSRPDASQAQHQVANGSAGYTAELLAQANEKRLSSQKQWRRILFYAPKWFGSESGLIDNPKFYLAEDGDSNPDAELIATIKNFFNPLNQYKAEDDHPLCHYPGRFHWLAQQLNIDRSKLPNPNCKAFHERIGQYTYEKVSLVFSSYYSGNPSSMLGHSFLRLHGRKDSDGTTNIALLDDIINFAANPTTQNPVLYPLLGIFGGFPGTFSMMPYYIKIQEYNNHESRDLWEYELDLTPEQVTLMLRVLWDVGRYHSNYYYFDENCSYLMLFLLEAADPKLELASAHMGWVLPADTLRTVVQQPGLVKNLSFRPSARLRFETRYHELDSNEKALLARFFNGDFEVAKTELQSRDQASRATVLDAGLEYIDFEEKLAATRTAETYKVQYEYFLTQRSEIPNKPKPLDTIPYGEQPDKGHGSSKIGFEMGSDLDGGTVGVDFLPSTHSLLADPTGYPAGLEIQFLRTRLHYSLVEQRPVLHEFRLLKILAVEPQVGWKSGGAWTMQLATERHHDCYDLTWGCQNRFFKVGWGESFRIGEGGSLAYILAVAQLGGRPRPGFGLYGAPGLEGGLLIRDFGPFRLYSSGVLMRQFGKQKAENISYLQLAAVFSLSRSFDVRVEIRREQDLGYGLVGLHFFY